MVQRLPRAITRIPAPKASKTRGYIEGKKKTYQNRLAILQVIDVFRTD